MISKLKGENGSVVRPIILHNIGKQLRFAPDGSGHGKYLKSDRGADNQLLHHKEKCFVITF